VFTQDFDLFHSSTPSDSLRRAPSLDSTLQPSFNTVRQAGYPATVNLNSVQTINNSTQRIPRSTTTRPPVPLFHSNSTGNLTNPNTTTQYYHPAQSDLANFEMGGGGKHYSPSSSRSSAALTISTEVNVAYQGTFGDLGDPGYFPTMDNTDFSQLLAAGPDGFTAINGNSDGFTVSPRDVFNNDSFPPSTSFTNLTTPGSTLIDTPDDDYQTSPMFSDNLGLDQSNEQWFSLFPDDNTGTHTPAPLMARTTSASSANQIVVHPGGEGNRKRSSTMALSPSPVYSPALKHSSVAGVNARKRDKPLPPIVVDESDQVALKRARNTAAARKSRAKKVGERDEMETEIAALKQEVEHWKSLALARVSTDDEADD